ncbi:uncharacterized protein LOC143469431 [Clavelina lepadiformis]|uniref:non-specific serine/threonine protein kinase n=1 Tax=Clavelina lepadiformis TaxID=159417 RepID=A0ABP0FX53_CLALP
MSSPVAKFRHFSRIFSVKSPKSNISVKPGSCGSTSSVNSPILSNFPAFHPDLASISIATPRTSTSPALCSTPVLENLNQAYKDLPKAPSSSALTSARATPGESRPLLCVGRATPYNKYLSKTARERHFGVSDTSGSASKLKKSTFENAGNKRQLHLNQKQRQCVISSSISPGVSRSARKKSSIMRLSGISLSPSSVSWATQSPICTFGHASPARFRWNSVNENFLSTTAGHLKNEVEGCPPGKLYFWEEDEEELITQEQLGRGGFGQVFKGIYRGEEVAVKKLKSTSKPRQVLLETLQGELNGLRLRHPNIVRTLVIIQSSLSLDTSSAKAPYYIVMEHAGKRNLSQVINDPTVQMSNVKRYRFCSDILNGLAYLHGEQMAHLDLKPSNVMVTSQGWCKLCDFGSCQVVSDCNAQINNDVENVREITTSSDSVNSTSTLTFPSSSISSTGSAKSSSQLMGTFIYRAPELLRGMKPTTKADIFSFSITAWQIWSRILPYSGKHNHAAVFAVVAFGARPSIPLFSQESLDLSPTSVESEKKFFDLLQICWNADPTQRKSALQARTVIESCIKIAG